MCQSCVQCSILAFYLRLGLAETGRHHMRRTIYAIMGFSVVNNTVTCCLGMTFTMVKSLVLQSNKYLTPLYFTYGTLNLLVDLIIWLIPLPTVFSVMKNLPTRKKILLALAFAAGMLCWGSTILRISLRKYVFGLGSDPSYSAPIFYVLYLTEVSLAIGCASVVTLRPLVVKITKVFNKLRGNPPPTNTPPTTGNLFRVSPGPAQIPQPSGYETRPSGPRATGNKGGFKELTIAGHELVEWKNNVVGSNRSQFFQQPCSCPRWDSDVEMRSIVVHTLSCPRYSDPAWGTPLQGTPVPVPATTDHGVTHYSSSSSGGDTLRTT